MKVLGITKWISSNDRRAVRISGAYLVHYPATDTRANLSPPYYSQYIKASFTFARDSDCSNTADYQLRVPMEEERGGEEGALWVLHERKESPEAEETYHRLSSFYSFFLLK